MDLTGKSIDELDAIIAEANAAKAAELDRQKALQEAEEIRKDIEAIDMVRKGWARLKDRDVLPPSVRDLELGKALRVTPSMKKALELAKG